MGPHELWDEPWEGLPEEEAAWEWDFIDAQENGPTKTPPDRRRGWKRWYFIYHEPKCTNVKISADREPQSGNGSTPIAPRGRFSMTHAARPPRDKAAERQALRRRVLEMYAGCNRERWDQCFALIDPKLRDQGRVELSSYGKTMRRFKAAYGSVRPWLVRISMHLDAPAAKQDGRPFAYVYVIWQDDAHGFHMFKERWVKQGGHWFTRVAGLVPNRPAPTHGQD